MFITNKSKRNILSSRSLSGKLLTSVWFICVLLFVAIRTEAIALPVYADTTSRPAADTLHTNDSIPTADSVKSSPPMKLEFDLVRHADDSIVQNLAEKQVFLYGNAEVTYGDIDLKAAFIRVDFNNNTIFARVLKTPQGRL